MLLKLLLLKWQTHSRAIIVLCLISMKDFMTTLWNLLSENIEKLLMKMFVEPADIYLYMDIVDFRKSINGLIVVVEQDMNLNPFRDALFVFRNKKRDKVKILYWDKTGFALWYKRLEKHRFKWPVDANLKQMHMSEQQLQWLLSGYDVIGHQPLHYNASGL